MSQFAHGIKPFDVHGKTSKHPILLLGIEYKEPDVQYEAYISHFQSIVWMTYRKDFEQMSPYEYRSDAGWGCMLRTSQMLLFQALQRHVLGPHWRLRMGAKLPKEFIQLLTWFVDSPKTVCQYSIHKIVKLGINYDKLPGEWYGPTTAALVLRDLVNLHSRKFGGFLSMYVPQDGVVYSEEVHALCSPVKDTTIDKETTEKVDSNYDPLLNPPRSNGPKPWNTALLILIPMRLGLDKLNEMYKHAIYKFFGFPQSVGIVGGKRGHSVYFVGSQESQLHILDPHTVQVAPLVNDNFPTDSHIRSVQCNKPLVIGLENIDPSMAIGFYCRDISDYEDLVLRIEKLSKDCTCPFSVAEARPDYTNDMDMDGFLSDGGIDDNGYEDEDDFVII